VPLAAGAYLALLPWTDTPKRPRVLVVLLPLTLVFGGAVAIGVAPVRKDARDAQYTRQRAKADARAAAAVQLAMRGVPSEGALAMVRSDPELRGRDLFEQHCASCHVLGDSGDAKKATATKLDGWGTPDWIAAMIHDPDAPEFFERGPYKEQMPSVDVRPKNEPPEEAWSPMVKSDAERRAVAMFLASLGDEPGDPPRALDEATRAQGEKLFSARCTSCHLYKGEGDDEGSGLAPEMAGYGSVAWTRAQVADPSAPQTYREKALDPAMKKHMPRFDKDLSPADVDLVARWTRAHARGIPLR
jgi:ubiquinol-cytochrome c reductase cytochrome b subunit